MKEYKISLSGDLGSGKSTVCDILVKRLGVNRVSAGGIQREEAKKRGMSIEDFNRFMETHPELDRELDAKIGVYDSLSGNYIFDSRLAWHFVPSAVSVYLKVAPRIAAERIFAAKRADESFTSIEETLESIVSRRNSELKRYESFYGLDLSDMSNYDCVIDTTNLSPEEVADLIVEAAISGKTK